MPLPDESGRLDSWKAIATYLKRDERTVRRWERERGLPVRRVPGRRGASVFAYAAEIDTWLQRAQATPVETSPARWRRPLAVAALVAAVGGGFAWWAVVAKGRQASRVEVTPTAIVAFNASGARVWEHPFPDDERAHAFLHRPNVYEVAPGRPPVLLAATSFRIRPEDEAVLGGQVFSFTPLGQVERAFSFDETVRFASAAYAPPWGITDVRAIAADGRRRVAVAAHHYTWWPSLVTLLDEAGRRQGTFVHAGWIEYVRWLAADRLIVTGYAQEQAGGMVALLDAAALDGAGPVAPDGPFACTGCAAGRPLRYVVMPRTEVNRAAAAPFNRARLQPIGARIQVRTIEIPQADGTGEAAAAADAIYEFTPSLDLLSASFSERYWEVHRALEAEGKLDHSREQCPDRDGPREIHVWESATGWRTLATR
jgi:hypothetical protein